MHEFKVTKFKRPLALRLLPALFTAFMLSFAIAAQSADDQSIKEGLSITRQKNFLGSLIVDLEISIRYMVEDIENLESRMDGIVLLEPGEREDDLSATKNDYEKHLMWLTGMMEAFERDYESYFTDAPAGNDWVERQARMVENYQLFYEKAMKRLAHFEEKRERLVYFLNRQQFLMAETESIRREVAMLENKRGLLPEEESRLDSLRKKLWAYQVEMNAIASFKEEMYLHYLLLIEQLRDKRDWLSMKMEEYRALSSLAEGLTSTPGEDFKTGYRRILSTYDKEVSSLKSKVDLMGDKAWSVVPYGDIRDVERSEEMIDYYNLMKKRYGDYKNQLEVKMDGFRADMDMR